ncbi:hypothetical protein ACGF5T_25155 [Streptomyces sp. NPDC047853]|uniref:hypothetical protein n=1 Tax=unclassified Streptomyces TaxID=2593676 RepID=UPI0034529B89
MSNRSGPRVVVAQFTEGLHCGLTGDVRNCRTMVMLANATAAEHAFIDAACLRPRNETRAP